MLLSTQIVVAGFAQTILQGMINSNVTLTKDKSPYLVVGDVVVFPKWKLTIEPGVELRFENGIKLQIRGTLEALGTENNPISFTSNTRTTMELWQGIEIMNAASFNYCEFSYASEAIYEIGSGVTNKIRNSRFTFNNVVINEYTGNQILVENCYFANNGTCLTGGGYPIVNNCIFENNEYGLSGMEADISNSTFTNHSQVALWGVGKFTNCIITNNNLGVRTKYRVIIDNCNISDNQVGVELYGGNGHNPITNSKICNNLQYNVVITDIYDIDLYDVCWCTSDSATVENLIYDAYEDYIHLGFVNYALFTEDCSEVIFKTHKAEGYIEYPKDEDDPDVDDPSVSVQNLANNGIIIYPTPASSSVFIKNAGKINSISIYDHTGKLVMDKSGFDNELIELNVSELISGLYIVRLANQDNKIEFKKIIIAR